MFVSQPLLDVLMGRGIEDVDSFIRAPSWSDLPDPFSIPGMEEAVDRVLVAVREKQRITVDGDYDCDGILSSHILQSILRRLGAESQVYLPHRDEGYGLGRTAVHYFSQSGTDLLLTVDNGINARAAVHLASRLGIEVIVIDHHRIQDRADTLAVWSDEFCGAGLAVLFAVGLALRAGWSARAVEQLIEGASIYGAIASIADCVPLSGRTRLLTKLGLAALSRTKHRGLQELLRASCGDPDSPDSEDVAFRIAPRINAAGRVAHPYAAFEVMAAGSDVEKARTAVAHLNHLNAVRRELVQRHFEELRGKVGESRPAALVLYREQAPKGIAGLLAAKCVERFGVPSIVLVPSGTPGVAVGSGRSVRGFDLEKQMQNFASLFDRFGGHPKAVGLTLPVSRVTELRRHLEESCRGLSRSAEIQAEADLSFASLSPAFYSAARQLEPFGEGNPAPVFRVRGTEVSAVKNRWVRLRQGRYTLELFNWQVDVESGMRGDCLVEFRGKTRNLLGFSAK